MAVSTFIWPEWIIVFGQTQSKTERHREKEDGAWEDSRAFLSKIVEKG